jgi:hypothetical protein
VEQRLARQAHNLEVVGSIPTGATGFGSSILHKINSTPRVRGGFFMRRLTRLRQFGLSAIKRAFVCGSKLVATLGRAC